MQYWKFANLENLERAAGYIENEVEWRRYFPATYLLQSDVSPVVTTVSKSTPPVNHELENLLLVVKTLMSKVQNITDNQNSQEQICSTSESVCNFSSNPNSGECWCKPSQLKCEICNRNNHNTADCRVPCPNCEQTGHNKLQCPEPVKCFKCGLSGHFSYHCQTNTKQSNYIGTYKYDLGNDDPRLHTEENPKLPIVQNLLVFIPRKNHCDQESSIPFEEVQSGNSISLCAEKKKCAFKNDAMSVTSVGPTIKQINTVSLNLLKLKSQICTCLQSSNSNENQLDNKTVMLAKLSDILVKEESNYQVQRDPSFALVDALIQLATVKPSLSAPMPN